MTTWAGFWLGLGFALGCWGISFALNEIAEAAVKVARLFVKGNEYR